MQWPKEIKEAFATGLTIEPAQASSPVIDYILNETARRAVGRAAGDPERLKNVIDTPYTPLRSVIPELGMRGKIERIERISFEPEWLDAIQMLYRYVRSNAKQICDAFRDHANDVYVYDHIDEDEGRLSS